METIQYTKQLIGNKWDVSGLRGFSYEPPYEFGGEGENVTLGADILREEGSWYPEDIATIIMKKLKAMAEDYSGENITQAVVSVPPYYTEEQQRVIRVAGWKAGLRVLRPVPEPIAAAHAYGLHRRSCSDNVDHFIVFDLGGTSLDVTLVELDCGTFEMLGTASLGIGGRNFSQGLINEFVDTEMSGERLLIYS